MVQEARVEHDLYAELDEFIDSLSQKDGALIPILHRAQHIFGYLSKEVQLHIAHKLSIPASKVFGVVTFYSYFRTNKEGQFRISVCMGTACFVRGSETVLQEFEKELNIKTTKTTEDGLFTLSSIRCVGACGLAPVVMVNDKVYGRVKPESVKGIVDEYLSMGGE